MATISLPKMFKLDSTNYQTWKVRMKLLFMKEGTWQYINPQRGNPPVIGEPPIVVAERLKDLHSLFMSAKENVFSNISEYSDPIVVWTTLAILYQQNNNA